MAHPRHVKERRLVIYSKEQTYPVYTLDRNLLWSSQRERARVGEFAHLCEPIQRLVCFASVQGISLSEVYNKPRKYLGAKSGMVLTGSVLRILLIVALVAVIACRDVAEAGSFGNIIKNAFGKMNTMIEKVTKKTTRRFSVLSKIFGEGFTRADLSLSEIINEAFSRNNSIYIANGTEADMDWTLGDGIKYIGAISSAGSVSVTSSNGVVTIVTGKQSNKEPKRGQKARGGKAQKGEPKGEKSREDVGKGDGNTNKSISGSGSDMNGAFFDLLERWGDFVTSSIWDVQEQEAKKVLPSLEKDVSLETRSRVINGIFFGNGVPSGASFMVKFFYNNEKNFYCCGSLVGYPYVLTAAHCGVMVGDDVRVGGRLLRSGYKAKVAKVIPHPSFKAESLVHDVAVVRLEGLEDKKVLLKNGVKAARLNRNDKFPQPGFIGVLSGHGSVETEGSGASDKLLSTRQTAHKVSKCQKEITQGKLNNEESYLCAGDDERSTTCVGDSGAGLWWYRVDKSAGRKTRKFYEVFGVVSFGEVTDYALCPRGPPTVFQRTSSNYEWIVDVVGRKNMR